MCRDGWWEKRFCVSVVNQRRNRRIKISQQLSPEPQSDNGEKARNHQESIARARYEPPSRKPQRHQQHDDDGEKLAPDEKLRGSTSMERIEAPSLET